nr:MAG TPA: hypothetical protein [Caudoviricetes sp.]DAT63279.1 MAG TPA: hypothetical protein [Caudoviricetes sp.]
MPVSYLLIRIFNTNRPKKLILSVFCGKNT